MLYTTPLSHMPALLPKKKTEKLDPPVKHDLEGSALDHLQELCEKLKHHIHIPNYRNVCIINPEVCDTMKQITDQIEEHCPS